jgi:type VI secretion system protein ImpK
MSDKTVMKPRPGGRAPAKSNAPVPVQEHTGDPDKTRMAAHVKAPAYAGAVH